MDEVDLVAMFNLCQQAARVLPAGGRIVNLASRAAFGALTARPQVTAVMGDITGPARASRWGRR